MEIPKRYDFAAQEPRIYRLWMEAEAFRADAASPKRPFVIVIPPPNITGRLHMGHALNNTLQDILIRMHRMRGQETLYLPGTDHAGIATQFTVEKALQAEGKTRFDLGREAFVKRVWEWKKEYGHAILEQLRRLGCSCDWSRTAFTLDPGYARAVLTVFLRWFRKGLIYRGKYLVNWCPRCKTALSDLEAERKEEAGKLWHLRYPIEGESGRFAVMATTRPETILGDTAVACHPDDPRYAALRGRFVRLPIVNRRIPVVADPFVRREFGTGMVKITPAHDFDDFQVGERHGLAKIQVIGPEGRMTKEAGPFAGMDRFECRRAIVERLDQDGLLEKVEDYPVVLARCYRCRTILEPYLSDQWFVKMAPLVAPAIRAVEAGEIRFFPERYRKGYLDWLKNIRDWCISRQLWWGHRIPVWTCPEGHTTASLETPSKCETCQSPELKQDEDVLDTWFSSALWPLATLGWPDETPELKKFYPTSVLITGREIINLWVARMIVTGFEFRGAKPFSDVVIHPIVQNIEGRRMSKSLGTGVDPLDLMEEYGADALRFLLARRSTGVQDIRLGLPEEIMRRHGLKKMREDRSILEARNFVTKVWNACRFVVSHADGKRPPLPPVGALPLEQRWILSRLATTIRRTTEDLDAYEFGRAAERLYSFVWDEFCDYTIELAKPRMEEAGTRAVLFVCIEAILKLLHPFVPFVTEALWQRLREAGVVDEREPLLVRAAWPEPPAGVEDPGLESAMQEGIAALKGVREIRNKMGIPPREPVNAVIVTRNEAVRDRLERAKPVLSVLGNVPEVSIGPSLPRPRKSASVVSEDFTLFVPLEGKIDLKREIQRQEKRLSETRKRIEASERKLSNERFRRGAPEEVVREEEERLAAYRRQAAEIERLLSDLT